MGDGICRFEGEGNKTGAVRVDRACGWKNGAHVERFKPRQ